MDSINSETEFRNKQKEVLERFTKGYMAGGAYYSDPFARRVVEGLIYGEDPYLLIETILENRQELFAEVVRLNEMMIPQPIIAPDGVMWFPPGWTPKEEVGE